MRIKKRNILTNAPDLPGGTLEQAYQIKRAIEPWELTGYAELRRRTFVDDQKLFVGSDHDEHDIIATPIIAVCDAGFCLNDVVGCVRIYPTEAGLTYFGSRLAVCPDWRGSRLIVAELIRAAVCAGHARGCERFLATVQVQNVGLFRRLHWEAIEEMSVCGQPHLLMRADLQHYPAAEIE